VDFLCILLICFSYRCIPPSLVHRIKWQVAGRSCVRMLCMYGLIHMERTVLRRYLHPKSMSLGGQGWIGAPPQSCNRPEESQMPMCPTNGANLQESNCCVS
jgi:hypothetical protein